MLSARAVLLLAASAPPPCVPPACGRTPLARACEAGGGVPWDSRSWSKTSWERLDAFSRMALMRGMLDGDLSVAECNHAAWRGLGYRIGVDGALRAPDGSVCDDPPNVLNDPSMLASMNAQLPDDEDEIEMLDTLIETLHGAALTKALIATSDSDFLARRTLVQWLYLTQPDLGL